MRCLFSVSSFSALSAVKMHLYSHSPWRSWRLGGSIRICISLRLSSVFSVVKMHLYSHSPLRLGALAFKISPSSLCILSTSAKPHVDCGKFPRLSLGDLGALAVQSAFAFLSTFPLRLCGKNAFVFAFPFAVSAPSSLAPAATSQHDDAADTREPFAALSGTSLASTPPTVSIQRQPPLYPPVISAVKCHNPQNKNDSLRSRSC